MKKKQKESIIPKTTNELSIGVLVMHKNPKLFNKKAEKRLIKAITSLGYAMANSVHAAKIKVVERAGEAMLNTAYENEPLVADGVAIHRYQFRPEENTKKKKI